jgi:Cu/Ag efflux protein CusF
MKFYKAVVVSALVSLIGASAFAQQTLTGTVAGLDEQRGTITIRPTQSGTVGESGAAQEFKANDGLLFNALRPGDKVTFTVAKTNGTNTITKLSKQ